LTSDNELERFNTVLRKVLSVPREELQRREEEWKRKQAQKKRQQQNAGSGQDQMK